MLKLLEPLTKNHYRKPPSFIVYHELFCTLLFIFIYCHCVSVCHGVSVSVSVTDLSQEDAQIEDEAIAMILRDDKEHIGDSS